MAKFSTAELVELFYQEVESYIPEIAQCLGVLASDNSDIDAIEKMHRLFHNIKGAASQVQLSDMSQGARVVESALDEFIEGGQPISDSLLTALDQTFELLKESCSNENHHDVPQNFHEQVAVLFTKIDAEQRADSRQNGHASALLEKYLPDVRAIFPLLQELVDCLVGDDDNKKYNLLVYGKLARAVSILAATVQAAGMRQQSSLLQEFQLLLQKLHSGVIGHQPELSGLILDFLQFLEISFSHENPENNTCVHRVKEQLQRFKALLTVLGQEEEVRSVARATDPLAALDLETSDFFDDPAPGDQADFLDEFDASDFVVKEMAEIEECGSLADPALVAESSAPVLDFSVSIAESLAPVAEPSASIAAEAMESIDEEQLLLMEIFREECDEHLIVISQSLNFLENQVKQPISLTPELLASVSAMRRAVHTLKGAASMTGLSLLARGAHVLEDMLDWLHDEAGTIHPREVQIIATGIDVIELLAQSPQAQESARLESLVDTINQYLLSCSTAQADEDSAPAQLSPQLARETAKTVISEPVPEIRPVSPAVMHPVQPAEPVKAENGASLPGDSGTLRVRIEDLDELVSIEGELVVARGAMEKMLEKFTQTLVELENVKDTLRRKSQELESGFEVQSLYGFSPVTAHGGGNGPLNSELADFDPIELDRYSQLNLIIRSLNEVAVDVNSIHATLSSLAGDIGGQAGKQQLTMRLMQDKLMRIRMTPLSSISRVLFRTVRDASTKLGKKVALTVTGEDVYMDRFVWAGITDPLMHILRNAVDHGIESPELRAVAGKPETAAISVHAEQRSRHVVLRIADDGGGIDYTLIRDKLAREGQIDKPENLSEKELLEYLFHPSFTTRQEITTLSGRGVGLDVVKRNIQDLRGSVQIHNNPGQGVVFDIQIPFSLSVNRAVVVSVAGKEYAVPLQDILQVKHFSPAEIDETEGLSVPFGDGYVPAINLGFHLQLEQKMDTLAAAPEGLLAILFMKGEQLYAVTIDSVVEQREIIVKNLGSHLTHVRGISGVTLTGSGGLIPILNLHEIVDVPIDYAVTSHVPLLQDEPTAPIKVLIVDDSISVRHSVARLVESRSWQQQQAVDGLDALAKLENFLPDVIILDIEMPRMNGYEFKSNINNQQEYKDIPVVMLTSRASEKHQKKARELGIDHYLTKPYQEETFVQLLEDICYGSSSVRY